MLKDEKNKTMDPERRKALQILLDQHLELQRYKYFNDLCAHCVHLRVCVVLKSNFLHIIMPFCR